mgnify:CR=1 FL=1
MPKRRKILTKEEIEKIAEYQWASIKDIFNIDEKDYKKLKTEVINLLRIKYSLEIISEDPLDFKRIKY